MRPDGVDDEVHRSPCQKEDAEDAMLDALCLSQCTDLVCIAARPQLPRSVGRRGFEPLNLRVGGRDLERRVLLRSMLNPQAWMRLQRHEHRMVFIRLH